ncbi:MAG TPA: ATP-binding cassette domain-containing protein [Firmicutes bacterium]|nr:ATP-binding cassette domain-containing protein [Bacillota bacterium]
MTIVGPNGAGKSTLLSLLGLVLRPSSGTIWVGGEKVDYGRRLVSFRRRLALVFQENLLIDGSVWDNVALGLRLRKMDPREVRTRVDKWLERFGIAHLARRHAWQISGGEARRVALARAFALEPEALLLDEPFASVDGQAKADIMQDLLKWVEQTGAGLITVTHDREEAEAMGQTIIRMNAGTLLDVGTVPR